MAWCGWNGEREDLPCHGENIEVPAAEYCKTLCAGEEEAEALQCDAISSSRLDSDVRSLPPKNGCYVSSPYTPALVISYVWYYYCTLSMPYSRLVYRYLAAQGRPSNRGPGGTIQSRSSLSLQRDLLHVPPGAWGRIGEPPPPPVVGTSGFLQPARYLTQTAWHFINLRAHMRPASLHPPTHPPLYSTSRNLGTSSWVPSAEFREDQPNFSVLPDLSADFSTRRRRDNPLET